MIIPENTALILGEIADYRFADGILYSYSKAPKRTVENIKRNVELVQKITNNKPVPLLIYLCNSPVPDKETRQFSTEQLPLIYSAMAMVANSGLTKLIMNVLFTLQSPPIPIKSFTNDKKAKEWLEQFAVRMS
ncbi:DUF7793 family protein [Pedobacter sp. MW01-1-1]|uniref:DUF7793 family protein n=1 Tax=Pedobacter sp. MW01-1-1 TaxID=3383027 RepID=UPI003FF103A6